MLLESLEILNFRNLNGKISFSNGLNIFAGDNGHGKTNWLEAIYLCGLTKSFKTPKLTDAIRFGESLAVVSGMVRESPEITRKLQVAIEGNTKNLSINDKKETVQRYLGQMHVVVFNADELEMIRGVPDARRRFLDGGIVSLHPPFVQTFTDYNRVVRQKNSLLANARDSDYSLDKASFSRLGMNSWRCWQRGSIVRVYDLLSG
ncbi:MAG: AAA family ATPase [Chloracidobacterium sp.]|nr:AAA family ATPase [Chloracidobacterium sp.]